MQVQTSTVHRTSEAKALKIDPKKARWTDFVYELRRLHGLDAASTPYDTALRVWYGVEAAYRALREVHTGKRRQKRSKGHDATLEPWLIARDRFLDRFWGAKGPDGKRHGSADPTIAPVMGAYQEAWGYWRKRTKSYARAKAKENARRNQLDHVKAKKAAWAKSEAGKKWWADKRAADRAARKQRREVLANV